MAFFVRNTFDKFSIIFRKTPITKLAQFMEYHHVDLPVSLSMEEIFQFPCGYYIKFVSSKSRIFFI